MTTLKRIWAAVYMFFKKRGGFIDLGAVRTVSGTVAKVEGRNPDGDFTFDLAVDPDQSDVLYFAGRRTADTLHCEVPPGTTVESYPKVGDRVAVTGRWAFDGTHHGHGVVVGVLAALVGWPPNVREGWTELHPVVRIETARS